MDLPTHQLTMTVPMTPDMANFAGNVHGGTILKFLDQVAYACASRYAGRYVVTLSVDQVMFREPIYVGELVTFLASIGIRAIITNAKAQQHRGGRMVLLVGENTTVAKTLQATGIDALVPMFTDAGEAEAAALA